MKHFFLIIITILVVACSHTAKVDPRWEAAINTVVHEHGVKVDAKLRPAFDEAGIHYPPSDISLLAFKNEGVMELWARDENTKWTYVKTYPLTAKSGALGPKLKEGDRQIPEGVYKIINFNPYSSFYLSLMLNYPNEYDQRQASREGRTNLGSDIFIHGRKTSAGCLAVGDEGIEELFVLVRRVGMDNAQVVIAPTDLRRFSPGFQYVSQPRWVPRLYGNISNVLERYQR